MGKIADAFPLHCELDLSVVMPNHVHGIIMITRRGESCIRPETELGDHKDRPYGTINRSLGRIVQAFKSITTQEYANGVKHYGWHPFPGRLWQRNYYEHIVRNDAELNQIRQYMMNNPAVWETDVENPRHMPKEVSDLSAQDPPLAGP